MIQSLLAYLKCNQNHLNNSTLLCSPNEHIVLHCLLFVLSSLNCFVHERSHKLFNIWSWNLLVWIGILCTCAEPMSFFFNMHERGCAWLCELSNSFETALTFILFHISPSKLTFRCISMYINVANWNMSNYHEITCMHAR